MGDRSSFGFLMDQLAGLVLGFILICVLMIPMAVMTSGWGGAAVLIFIVVIFVLCMLSGKENDKTSYNTAEDNKINDDSFIYRELKRCPNCNTALKKKIKKCPRCGYKF